MLTKEQRKAKAVEIMQKMGIYPAYINGYKNHDKVCFYERFGGYWVYQEPEIEEKMRELEQRYDITVYAITHELTGFGELWSFLYVSNNGSDNKHACVNSVGRDFICLAYVWNKTDDWCSEFGSVEVRSFGGGLMRIA